MADWVIDLDRVNVTDRDGVSARLAGGSDEMRVDVTLGSVHVKARCTRLHAAKGVMNILAFSGLQGMTLPRRPDRTIQLISPTARWKRSKNKHV